jgi:hypothetical protein
VQSSEAVVATTGGFATTRLIVRPGLADVPPFGDCAVTVPFGLLDCCCFTVTPNPASFNVQRLRDVVADNARDSRERRCHHDGDERRAGYFATGRRVLTQDGVFWPTEGRSVVPIVWIPNGSMASRASGYSQSNEVRHRRRFDGLRGRCRGRCVVGITGRHTYRDQDEYDRNHAEPPTVPERLRSWARLRAAGTTWTRVSPPLVAVIWGEARPKAITRTHVGRRVFPVRQDRLESAHVRRRGGAARPSGRCRRGPPRR